MNPYSESVQRDSYATPLVNIESYHHDVLNTLLLRLKEPSNIGRASIIAASEPGMGKTHLLWRLAQKAKQNFIPIYISPISSHEIIYAPALTLTVSQLWNSRDNQGNLINEFEIFAKNCLQEGDSSYLPFSVEEFTSALFQDHYLQHKDEFLRFMSSHLSRKANLNESQSDWARALLDILYTKDWNLETYARAWIRGIYASYHPSIDSESDGGENESRCQQRLADIARIFAIYKPLLFIFDQVENYVLFKNEAKFKTLVWDILHACPRTQVVISCNGDVWTELKEKFFEGRCHDALDLNGLNYQEAIELRDARALGQENRVKQKIPDAAVRKILGLDNNGKALYQTSPRRFLKECEKLWDGIKIGASIELPMVHLEKEFSESLNNIKNEGIQFRLDSLYTFFIEILGAEEKCEGKHSFYLLDEKIIFCEPEGNNKRWEAFANKARILSSNKPERIMAVRRAACLSEHERLAHPQVPGKRWRDTHPWKHILAQGATTKEISLPQMTQILAATRLLDSAVDLDKSRSEIASWLRPRMLELYQGSLDLAQSSPFDSVDKAKIVVCQESGGNNGQKLTSLTVSELTKILVKGGELPSARDSFSLDRRGIIFHELAHGFVKHLVTSSRVECNLQQELSSFLTNNSLWKEAIGFDNEAPRLSDALKNLADNLSNLRDRRGNMKTWEDIFPTPHGEQSIHHVLTECNGIKLFVSGRIDLVRRVNASGKMEIVDYKLTTRFPDKLQVEGQTQLALYAQLLRKQQPKDAFDAVLEIYSPQLTEMRFTTEQIESFYLKEIEPNLFKLVQNAPQEFTPSVIHGSNLITSHQEVTRKALPVFSEVELPPQIQKAFDGYVGNKAIIGRIKTALAASLSKSESISLPLNLMLFGSGGLGKSELARRIAKALGLPLVELPGSSLKSIDDLLEKIDAQLKVSNQEAKKDGVDSGLPKWIYPPLVVFIDEVHEMRRNADKLLNLFEPRERRAVASDRVALFANATMIAATTDKGLLPTPFLTRFNEYALEPYTADEVAQILSGVSNVGDHAFCKRLAIMSRLNPRIAKQRLKEFSDYHEVHKIPATEDGLKQMEPVWNVDSRGLSSRDYKYLEIIKKRAIGLSSISRQLDLSEDEVARDIEPFLLQSGLIQCTDKGRELTLLGKRLLS